MKLRLLRIATLAALFTAHGLAAAQDFDYEKYKPAKLPEIIKKYSDPETLTTPDLTDVFGATFPSRIRVTYTGSERKISGPRREHIRAWARTYGHGPEIADLFETELLFVEDSAEYWLPVQKQVVPYFAKELKKGERVTLFIIAAGGKKIAGEWDWIFLVNEFEKEGA